MNEEKRGYANLITGWYITAGKIYYYSDHAEFYSNSIFSSKESFMYSDIVQIEKFSYLGIVPNAITISFRNGECLKFAVNSRNDVIKYLSVKADLSCAV